MGPWTGKVTVVNVQITMAVGRGYVAWRDRCVTVEPFQNQYKKLLRSKVCREEGKDTKIRDGNIILFLSTELRRYNLFLEQ